jgi:DNA-directed RNA polymerase specialized sigma subunit
VKCYKFQEENCTGCKVKKCRYWINDKQSGNCVIVASKIRDWTLQDIGDLFSVTRMRICQIEKSVLKKIRKKIQM